MAPKRPPTTPTPKSPRSFGFAGKPRTSVLGTSASVTDATPTGDDCLPEVVRLLCELLDTENTALRKFDVGTVRELSDRKDRLARLYEDHMKAIAKNRTILESLTPENRMALKALGLKLDARVSDNVRLLAANVDASQRFMTVIVNAVRDGRTNVNTYSAAGIKENDADRGRETSLALDRDI